MLTSLKKKGLTTKETTEEVVELDAKGEAETLDEVEDTDEEAVDNLEDSVDGVVNLLEELGLDISSISQDLVMGTYNDVELGEFPVDAANEDVDSLDDIDENLSGNVFVCLGAGC
jgi:hypothetical protein